MIRKKFKASYILAALLFCFTAIFGALAAVTEPRMVTAKAEDDGLAEVKVKIYYYRDEADYNEWNLWIWTKGNDGAAYQFQKDSVTSEELQNRPWKVTDYITLRINPADSEPIGFIVRCGEWLEKDVAEDRFIDASQIVNGEVTLYLRQDDATIHYSPEGINLSPYRFGKSFFSGTKEVTAQFNKLRIAGYEPDLIVRRGDPISGDILQIAKPIELYSLLVIITLEDEIDIGIEYYIVDLGVGECNYGSAKIMKHKLFETQEFEDKYNYLGELGAEYSAEQTVFRVWSPFAKSMKLRLYNYGTAKEAQDAGVSDVKAEYSMTSGEKGVWTHTVTGDLDKVYYVYVVDTGAGEKEAVDPYARAAGLNGQRGMVIDLSKTNPEGWEEQLRPKMQKKTDAIIYEAHIRDLTIDSSSGVSPANRGKYLGMTETGTKNSHGQSTALDYIKNLGVTEIHILPMYDYQSVDEANPTFNWGYDPQNYNVPEGGYSSNPYKGEIRINELKQMVMALHEAGIRVIMDVVYNHTFSTDSNFQSLVPDYYYRLQDNGKYFNGSGCGNETASDHFMFSRFMVDSVMYWAREYKLDGFRFDLMGLHDIDTMNNISAALKEFDPNILIYGEGWAGGTSGLAAKRQATISNAKLVPDISFFNDKIRDGVKGSVFDSAGKGFVNGGGGGAAIIKGAKGQPDLFSDPDQSINYVSCHDNLTLWDKLTLSATTASEEQRKRMNKMAAAAVFTSQGVPFFLAGEEMLRSKPIEGSSALSHNSYNLPDYTNSMKWDLLNTNADMVSYYKGLIDFRKAHPAFRSDDGFSIEQRFSELSGLEKDTAGYTLDDGNGKIYIVLFNAAKTQKSITIPYGNYSVYINGNTAGTEVLSSVSSSKVTLDALSVMVMHGATSTPPKKTGCGTVVSSSGKGGSTPIIVGALALCTLSVAFATLKGKRKSSRAK